MDEKRRKFLKKSALATIGASAVTANAVELKDLYKKIKNSSGKKDEVLYKISPEWELFYKQAK